MAINFSKINLDLAGKLRVSAQRSFDDGKYIEAFTIQMLFLEATIAFIVWNILFRKDISFEKKEDIAFPTHFSSLINYFYTLTFEKDMYQQLKNINTRRNKIIHQLLTFQTFDSLQQEARVLYISARELELQLLTKYDEYFNPKKKSPLTQEEVEAQILALRSQLDALGKQLNDNKVVNT